MIEGIRQVHLVVQDLALARHWYSSFFALQPYLANDAGVTFSVDGYLLEITAGGLLLAAPSPQDADPAITRNAPAPADGPLVYWGVDDLRGELARLSEAGIHTQAPMQMPDGDTKMAWFRDPFGNRVGLLERHDTRVLHAREQRSAEKIALRNVRATLDELQSADAQGRKFAIALFVVVALAVLLSGVWIWARLASDPMSPKGSDFLQAKPLAPPAPSGGSR